MFTELFAEIAKVGEEKTRTVLTRLAGAVEKQAKINASNGSHRYGTPTPASPGTGPATISRTLRGSLTHTPIMYMGGGFETRVGTAAGVASPYGSRTPASKYGMYLERGMLRNGAAYPFLLPAHRFAVRVVAPQLYQSVFRPGWPRI